MAMKSCLKHSPPTTPNMSQLSSPEGSRCSTPPLTPSTARKCVSFCQEDEGLEEVFEADDWDRSPTPMTPKLSYQDVLELKQLRLTLPRPSAINPTYQRPFTTSAPRSTFGPQCGPPISRFAAAPSLTPSKWKNRDDSRSHVDSEILPYLEAVPIQLLPLLDTPPCTPDSASPSDSQQHSETDTPTPTDLDTAHSPSASALTPIEAPTTSASKPSPSPLQITPVVAPSIIINSPSSPSPVISSPTRSSPLSSPPASSHDITPKSSPRRTPNFHFLPLLPVQDTPPPPPEPLVQKPAVPQRKMNMSFVPLLPPVEPEAVPSPQQQSSPSPSEPSLPEPAVPVEEALASLSLHHETQSESETDDATDNESASGSSSTHHRRRLMMIPMYSSSPSSSTTPSLSSASDTDDLDTESETPSVVGEGSAPSSPTERDSTSTEYFATVSDNVAGNSRVNSPIVSGEVNPYFPSIPSREATPRHHSPRTPRQDAVADVCMIARPGQTPPLSSLYPESTILVRNAETGEVVRKVKLEAIPSPSLVPPSPFSLYPPSPEMERPKMQAVPVMRRAMFNVRGASKLGSEVGVEEKKGLALLGPSFTRRKDEEGELSKEKGDGSEVVEVEVVGEVEQQS